VALFAFMDANALGVLSEACAHGYSLMFNEGENNDEKKK